MFIRDEYKSKFKDEFIGSCFISFSNEKEKKIAIDNHALTVNE